MIGALSDYAFLTFLYDEYEKNQDKMSIVDTFLLHNRKIKNIDEFILDNSLVPESASEF